MTRIEFGSKSKAAKMVVALAEKGIPATLQQHGWFVVVDEAEQEETYAVEELANVLDGKVMKSEEKR